MRVEAMVMSIGQLILNDSAVIRAKASSKAKDISRTRTDMEQCIRCSKTQGGIAFLISLTFLRQHHVSIKWIPSARNTIVPVRRSKTITISMDLRHGEARDSVWVIVFRAFETTEWSDTVESEKRGYKWPQPEKGLSSLSPQGSLENQVVRLNPSRLHSDWYHPVHLVRNTIYGWSFSSILSQPLLHTRQNWSAVPK